MRITTLCLTICLLGCQQPEPTQPLVDWDAVEVEMIDSQDDALGAIEPVDSASDEPPAASVPLGPATDTASVADETGRLPGDAGYKAAKEEIEPPTWIKFVTSPESCPPCLLMEADQAKEAIKERYPTADVAEVMPARNETIPMLKIMHRGRERWFIKFYPTTKTHPSREQRLAAMFAAIEKKLAEEPNQ